MNNNQQLQPIIAIIDNESFKSDYLYGNSLTELKEKLLEKNITLYSLTKTKIQDHDFSKIFVISSSIGLFLSTESTYFFIAKCSQTYILTNLSPQK